MAEPTRAGITQLVRGLQYGSSEKQTEAADQIEEWLKEAKSDIEAPALRKQLKKAIDVKIQLEARVLELEARLLHATSEQPPIIIGAGGFLMIEDRNELDFKQLSRGVPFILLDQPIPANPPIRTVPPQEVDALVKGFVAKRDEDPPAPERTVADRKRDRGETPGELDELMPETVDDLPSMIEPDRSKKRR